MQGNPTNVLQFSIILLYSTVLEAIEQHPAAEEFIEPVDRERATDYYDVITEPMCLADMATNVLEGIYKTPKMVKNDVLFIDALIGIHCGDSCAVL